MRRLAASLLLALSVAGAAFANGYIFPWPGILVSGSPPATQYIRPWFQAAGTAANTTTGTVSPAWPTHATDDVGLLTCETQAANATTLDTANGFAAVTNSPQNDGNTPGTRLTVYWARATSGAMSAPVISHATGDHIYCRIITWRGVTNSGNPWEVTPDGGIKGTPSTTTTFGAVTTAQAGEHIVNIASRDNDSTAAAWSAWANTSLVTNAACANAAATTRPCERADGGTTSGDGGGIGVASGILASAGSSGATTATVTSSSDGHMTIALLGLGVSSKVSVDATSQGQSNGTNTVSCNHTVGAGATSFGMIIIANGGAALPVVSSATYNGSAMTSVASVSSTDTFKTLYLYGSNGITLGTGAKTATFTTVLSQTDLSAFCYSFTNGNATTTFGHSATGITSTWPVSQACTSAAGNIVLQGAYVHNDNTATVALSTDAMYDLLTDNGGSKDRLVSWMEGWSTVTGGYTISFGTPEILTICGDAQVP